MHAIVNRVSARTVRGRAQPDLGFAAAVLAMFMAQLDGMAISASLPTVAADLGGVGGLGGIAGVSAAYLVAMAVSTPLHGQFGDRYGRRVALLGSVLVFGAGSLACAFAPALPTLVAARALQGLGGGGLIVGATSAMGELFDKAALIRRQGWLTAVSTGSLLAGPLLGGVIADGPGWRWIFGLNLPVCVVVVVLGAAGLPAVRREASGFDPLGLALVAVGGASLIVLGTGSGIAANPMLAPLLGAIALAAGIGLVAVERRVRSPLLPASVRGTPALRRSLLALSCVGLGIYGTMAFVPLLISETTGVGAAGIGGYLVVMNAGSVAVSATFAVLTRRWPRMVPWGRIGLVVGAIALGLLLAAPYVGGRLGIAALVVGLAGYGLTFTVLMSAYTLLAQSKAAPEAMGSAMAALQFVRQAGGSLATAAYGWLALVVAGGPSGPALTAIFAVAAASLVVGLLVGPRRVDE